MNVSTTARDKETVVCSDLLFTHTAPHWKKCETQGFINYLHLPNNWVIPQRCLYDTSLPPFISFELHWNNWTTQVLRKWAGESRGLHHANRWSHVTHQWQIMLFPCMQSNTLSLMHIFCMTTVILPQRQDMKSSSGFEDSSSEQTTSSIADNNGSHFPESSDIKINKTWPQWDIDSTITSVNKQKWNCTFCSEGGARETWSIKMKTVYLHRSMNVVCKLYRNPSSK